MLWLCLDLPFLPLETCARASSATTPFAVSERPAAGGQRTQQIVIANEAAMRAGVRPGMPLAAAHALVSNLQVVGRDDIAERAALERLAAWAGQFTSHVSLLPPRALLLDIEGSLTLFGGLKRLRHVLRSGVAELGFTPVLAVAPTPLAATWLAQAADEEPVTDMQALTGRLFELPLDCVGLTPPQYTLLRGMGLATLGECLRLPRDGLARRLGGEFVFALDRAFGRLPDPREMYSAPARFNASLALPDVVDTTEGVLFPLNRLLLELCGTLSARLAGVQQLMLHLHHPKTPSTKIEFGLARPTRDIRHLTTLFRERLARVELPEPVEEVALSAHTLLPLAASEVDFFVPKQRQPQAAAELIERLSARLGQEAVRGVTLFADHRPERAWQYRDARGTASAAAVSSSTAERPLWLLREPVPLPMQDGHPHLDGVLKLEPDRERIESGWWDNADVRRDYFVAHDIAGASWWVYRELSAEGRWWVQGAFG